VSYKATVLAAIAALVLGHAANANPKEIGLDYAYYNPVSLLLKEKGWLEEEFKKDNIQIRWALSQGSNKSLEYLNGASVDFGSTAGGAAIVGKSNGNPIQGIYLFSRPEWTALVTKPGNGISKIEDLKGKRIAVTRGTDPHLFLLQALNKVGLKERDVRVVLLQHPDGATALEQGQVDAWAGLDPFMAKLELESNAVLFHRAPELNTYGVLNVREAFAKDYPTIVERVITVYERGRAFARQNPNELRDALVRASKLPERVAEKQLKERTDLNHAVPSPELRKTLVAAGHVLVEIGVLKSDVDVEKLVDAYIEPKFAERVVKKQAASR
jgi:sulfonate transport system substrate-binding protein